MPSDFRKVIRDHLGGEPSMVEAVMAAHEAELAELRAEVRRLTAEPTWGDVDGQAQSWRAVWDALQAAGMRSWEGSVSNLSGRDLAVVYVRVLARDRDQLLAFVRSLLNPEERGHAVPAHVRDDALELLGMRQVEGAEKSA